MQRGSEFIDPENQARSNFAAMMRCRGLSACLIFKNPQKKKWSGGCDLCWPTVQAFWRQIPLYTQYIQGHTLEELMHTTLANLEGHKRKHMTADAAAEIAPALGSLTVLPFAVYVRYCSLTIGKPTYFIHDLLHTLLANCLHMQVSITPYTQVPDFIIYPRYWSLGSGDTTAGKTPTLNMCTKSYNTTVTSAPELWPFTDRKSSNLYEGGSHGAFQEKVRETLGRMYFVGAEGVNYLSPTFPFDRKCDTSQFF